MDTLQVALALLFLFSGVMKFIMPVQEMTRNTPLSGGFLHFIGAAEILGALGLVFPWLFRLWRGLTPLATVGLLIILLGATVTSVITAGVVVAILPSVTGILTGIVAWRRWSWLRLGNMPEKAVRAAAAQSGLPST